jgi:peptidoglycan hydrolase-like protein with peptidoglycan-binding domain
MRYLFNLGAGATALALATAFTVSLPASIVSAQIPGSPAMAAGSSSVEVKALQEALNRQGVSVKVDGVMGPATREAIKIFQSQHHLPVSGEPDEATLAKLGVQGPRVAAPAAQARMHGATQGRPSPQGGMMHGRKMQGGMMAHCQEMHQQMRQMMAQMQGMMKSMQEQMPAPKPN